MIDRLSPERRSWLMSQVKSKNTLPEMRVRRFAHALGLRFRLHRKNLPGRPDLVFPKQETVIFVHGCFWHRHPGCSKASMPRSRTEYWQEKFTSNIAHDAAAKEELLQLGWQVLTIWECETRNPETLKEILYRHFKIDR